MKTWTLPIIMMLMIPVASALIQECEEVIEPGTAPCLLLTNWGSSNCNHTIIKIYNETPLQIRTLNMSDWGLTGRCNATFNITKTGSYLLNYSNGDSARIKVEVSDNMMLALVFLIGIVDLLIIMFIFKMDDEHFLMKLFGLFFVVATFIIIGGIGLRMGQDTVYEGLSLIFYRGTLFFMTVFSIYWFMWYNWKGGVYLSNLFGRKKE